jgi:hypothetical protein
MRWHNGQIRRSPNPNPEEVFQDCIAKWEESVAHSIVARSFFPPMKAVYICADQPCPSHFSLASRRRTIHSGYAVIQDPSTTGGLNLVDSPHAALSPATNSDEVLEAIGQGPILLLDHDPHYPAWTKFQATRPK